MLFKEETNKFLNDYAALIDYYPLEIQYLFDQAHQATRALYESGTMDKVFNFINEHTVLNVSSPYEIFTLLGLTAGHPKAIQATLQGEPALAGMLRVLANDEHNDLIEPIIQELHEQMQKVTTLVQQLTLGLSTINKIDPPDLPDGPI